MLKSKINFKFLLALGIMLIAVFILNMGTVNAATEVEELYNKIPIVINVSSTAWEEAFSTIKNDYKLDTSKIIEKIDLSEGYDLRISLDSTCLNRGTAYIIHNGEVTGNGKAVWVQYKDVNVNAMVWEEISNIIKNEYELDIAKIKEKVDLPEGNTLHIIFENANDLNGGTAYITNNNTSFGIGRTFISVHYKDEEVKNATDEQIATELIESLGKIEFTYQYEGTLGTGDLTDTIINSSKDVLVSSMKDRFNTDSKNVSFKILQSYDLGDHFINHYVGVFVNKVYYGSATVSQEVVEKKEEETKPVTTTDDTTNIKLDTNTNVVPKGTTIKAQRVIEKYISKEIKSSIKKISTTYIVYDIYLSDTNGVKIQPNGNVKISIPIPDDFDKSSLCVYRMAEDGTSIKYDVKVEGNYATFETDHFSTYVLAEKETEAVAETPTEAPTETPTTNETNNNREKDDTPKTGNIDMIYFILPVAIISAVGIAVFKRKETK